MQIEQAGHYQFTFQQLADNTHALLESLGVSHATIIGHSTGGMLAMRYALMFPAERGSARAGGPNRSGRLEGEGRAMAEPGCAVSQELQTTAESIRDYERATYYAGTWQPQYETWVQMLAGMYRGPGREAVAWDSALLYDMIYTQPVFYEFEHLSMPVLLMIGDKDTTAIGKALAPSDVRAILGNYPALGKAAAARMPHARLIEFPDLGHAPQIQAPDRFHGALMGGLLPILPP